MSDNISVFSGIKPTPIDDVDWMVVLKNIQSDRYKKHIESVQAIKDPDVYRQEKTKLPAVTFSGKFKDNRQRDNVVETTGFIIPDLDHLQDVEAAFSLFLSDRNIWFAFRSPSGKGIKCGIRCKGIDNDDDIKKLYDAVERYFKEVYGIKIDPACKDISRLTFVSYDPKIFINSDPIYFDIDRWAEQKTPALPPDPPSYRGSGWKERYGLKVIESCCSEIRASQPGEQHYIRLKKARLIGGFIGEYIDEDVAIYELEKAVTDSGAKRVSQAMKTVIEGIEYGKATPITVEGNLHVQTPKHKDTEYYFDLDEVSEVSRVSEVSNGEQGEHESATCKQDLISVSTTQQTFDENVAEKPSNLAAHIREWIINSTGSFMVDQIDREFCLTTRLDKNARSRALNRFKELELIRPDKRFKGKWHIIDSNIDFIDLDFITEEPFPINLPFNLHDYVKIPKKAIIIIAGTSNAGKTALALNTLRLNLSQEYKKMYLMSEMGGGEYKSRVMSFDMPISEWKKVKAASKSYDFDGAIQHYNKNGLTCIDYLEEIDGEYFKISSSIRDVYDSLQDGVALINIQKKTGGDFARGGEATTEKARLYMALDFIVAKEASIVCALKIVKLKEFKAKNLVNHEIHFELTRGAVITPLTDWLPSYKIDRKQCVSEYEDKRQRSDDKFTFKTKEGPVVVINLSQADKWQETYSGIDVKKELTRISDDSYKKPFLKYKGYFFQLSGILATKDKQ